MAVPRSIQSKAIALLSYVGQAVLILARFVILALVGVVVGSIMATLQAGSFVEGLRTAGVGIAASILIVTVTSLIRGSVGRGGAPK